MSAVEARLSLNLRSRALSEKVTPAPLIAHCFPIRYDTNLAPLVQGLVGNAFQSLPVLSNWFATFAGRGSARECFLVTLSQRNGTPVLALPLIRRRIGGLLRLELPSSGVIDFTTPFLNPDHDALPAPDAIWALLRPVLPKADLVVFRRMAGGNDVGLNPLFEHPDAQPSRFVTWRIEPLAPREARHARLAKPVRKKLRRCREKFLALPGARFVVARTREEAAPLMAKLEALQGLRIRAKGLQYGLDCPRVRSFYSNLVAGGIENDETLLVGMMVGEEIIAVGYAILTGKEAVYVRVANSFGDHASLAPGLLISDFAMDVAFARGATNFDFGMGDYRFKRELGGRANPLRDLILPLSLKGAPMAYALRWYQKLSLNPWIRGLCGRKPLAEPTA